MQNQKKKKKIQCIYIYFCITIDRSNEFWINLEILKLNYVSCYVNTTSLQIMSSTREDFNFRATRASRNSDPDRNLMRKNTAGTMKAGAILMRVSLIAYQLTFKRQDLIRSIWKIATLSPASENEISRVGNVAPSVVLSPFHAGSRLDKFIVPTESMDRWIRLKIELGSSLRRKLHGIIAHGYIILWKLSFSFFFFSHWISWKLIAGRKLFRVETNQNQRCRI